LRREKKKNRKIPTEKQLTDELIEKQLMIKGLTDELIGRPMLMKRSQNHELIRGWNLLEKGFKKKGRILKSHLLSKGLPP